MRLFGAQPTFVSVIFAPKKIVCATVAPTRSAFTLKAYEEFNFEQPCIQDCKLFLTNVIKKHLATFFTKHTSHQAYTLFSLVPPGIHERVIGLQVETPQEHHLQQDEQAKRLIWDYVPLGHSQSAGKTYYYACGITRELLFQYQLLATLANLNCIAIVPQRVALLTASKYICPESTATSSITNHAGLQNYIKYSLEQGKFENLFMNAQSLEKKVLMEIFGLLLLGKEIYEHY